MSGLRAMMSRLLATLGVDRNADLDDEVRLHLEMQALEYERQGMTPEAARAAALERFGQVEPMKNDYRDRRVLPSLDAMLRDVRYSARVLRRNPAFAVMAFLTLAIGIGATTAVFSLVNRALLQPLPIERPHEVISLNNSGSRGMLNLFSYPNYVDLRARVRTFSALIAYRFTPIAVRSNGVNERLWGYLVSGNYFDVLGVRPAIGRAVSPADDVDRGGHPVAVISFRYWQLRFGSDPGAIGRPIIVNGRQYTIIGVAPRGFFGTDVVAAPDLWFPLAMQPVLENGSPRIDDRRADALFVLGRLAPGVGRGQAAAELDGVAAGLAREFPDVNGDTRVVLTPPGLFGGAMRGPLLGFTGLLLTIAALVLLVACVNLANLLLARAIDRRHEVAIRLSIGAGRLALIRQLLIESLMLSMTAGTAGLVLAWWLMRATAAIRLPIDIPLVLDLPLDGRVLLFNVVLSIVTAVLFGLVPALQASKADLSGILKDAGLSNERQSIRWRNALIVVQVAVSLVLLTGAGLMWRALGRTQTMDLGFSTRGAVEVSFDLRLQGYAPAEGREIHRRLLEAVRAQSGITRAALADVVPIDLHFSRTRVSPDGAAVERDTRRPVAFVSRITPRYFETMQTRIEEGRDFTDLDTQDSTPVAIVNRSLASRLWPGERAIGRRLRLGGTGDLGAAAGPVQPNVFEIVGIVADTKFASFNDTRVLGVYRPLAQAYSGSTSVVARTDGDITAAIAAVKRVVAVLDPNMPIASARSFEERLSVPLLPARVTALALAGFGALALVLAAIGVYGVMSYAVSSRTHEIGVRMALGAQRGDVLKLVLGTGARLIGLGVLGGVLLALGLMRAMHALLFGISPSDPATYAVVAIVLAGVAFLACWIPARRAVRTNPLDALRAI